MVRARAIAARVAFCCAFASAASIVVSIAVSQIFLVLGVAALLFSDLPLRMPPLRLPLALFILLTFIAVLSSPDPAAGLPQIRKLFVFAILPLVASTFLDTRPIRWLLYSWAGLCSLSALRGIGQYLSRRQVALRDGANTYDFFLDDRITGFSGHWMTFGGVQMIVVVLLAALLLFSRRRADRLLAALCLPLLGLALALSLTRSIFLLGAPLGLLYLAWCWKPKALLALPALALIAWFAVPFQVRERAISVLQPHGQVDSNSRRAIMRRTGWQMVKAHPWLGLGPEQIKPQFQRYVPAGVPRPLPPGWYGHLHNVYLQYAAERGVPALLCMMWFLAAVVRLNLRSPAGCPEHKFLYHGAIATVLAVLAEGFFEYNLGDSEVLTMFLTVVAASYVASEAKPCE